MTARDDDAAMRQYFTEKQIAEITTAARRSRSTCAVWMASISARSDRHRSTAARAEY
jgi:hypothetical protein